MSGTIEDGSVVFARRFGVDEFERFDIVVVRRGGINLIKRVVGVPGEAIMISGGELVINGAVVTRSYADGYISDGGIVSDEYIVLGDSEYFILGDNYSHSEDSRSFGAVDVSDIKGVVIWRLFPFRSIGRIM